MTTQPPLNLMGNMLLSLDGAMLHMVEVFRHCDGGLDGLQCEEAEALAQVLEVLGGDRGVEAARNVIRTHAGGDDEGRGDVDESDQHHGLWHEMNPNDGCHAGDECEALVHDTTDDEIERRKDGQ